ncbi:MAG TPA: class I SAM-dependent methyltransferase [Gemmatimonadales bacterium]|nr:class I SAM-dependent methyltransferase [Gemmatimonadales bacterium]
MSRAAAPYDRKAAVYDAIVGRSAYHRVFWGTSPRSLARFGRAALDAAGDGPFAEVGCGSLLFTAPMYRDAGTRSVALVDRSMGMLGRGRKRLGSPESALPAGIAMVQADGTMLPLRRGTFSAILSLNLLHIPCDRTAIVAQCAGCLLPGRGRLFVTSLVRSGRWSDAWMAILHRAGELDVPLAADELREKVAGRWAVIESMSLEGNMCFLVVRHSG